MSWLNNTRHNMSKIMVSLHPRVEGTKYLGSQWTFFDIDNKTEIQVVTIEQAERVVLALGYPLEKVDDIISKVERKTGYTLDCDLELMEIINAPSK
jgi:hypothetical protein